MKTQAYKLETVKNGAYWLDAGNILIVVYIGIIIFSFLLGTILSLLES